ncbi:MAG: T9SS type A sorting domain-containing protein [Paludibacter sp.]
MKQFMLCLLLAGSVAIQAQKYVPFPSGNAQWNVFYASAFNQIKIDTTLLKYSLQGDTTINGISYHKLCKITGSDANPQYVFAGGLREQDKKVFYYGFGYSKSNLISLSNQTYLLYDFNKKTGDSVMFDRERWYKIINTDSVKFGSDFRKRFEIVIMHSNTSEFIIEGIGDVTQGLLGMITPIPTCMDCFFNWEFVSFSQNDECVYKNPDYVDCGSTRKWSEVKYLTDNSYWTNLYNNKYQYYLNGDTTLNGKSYKKVFNQYLFEESPGSGKILYTTYQGAIREENGKIFALLNNNSNHISGEFLLYDFTVGVGDTIKSNISKDCGCILARQLIVTKIDTITLLNGEKRKKIQLDGSPDWIEGIGSVSSLFYDAFPLCTCSEHPHLTCFKQNDIPLYNTGCPDNNCCDLLAGVLETRTDLKRFTLLPNPTKDFALLQFTNQDMSCNSVEILNVLGRSVKTIPVSNASEYKLDFSDYSAGIYYVLLKYKDRTESHKIIKM